MQNDNNDGIVTVRAEHGKSVVFQLALLDLKHIFTAGIHYK